MSIAASFQSGCVSGCMSMSAVSAFGSLGSLMTSGDSVRMRTPLMGVGLLSK